jgi:hypothetical protein
MGNSNRMKNDFIRDIPKDPDGKQDLYNSIVILRDSLKLDTLENGFDSLQIRIWFTYPFTDRQQLVILSRKHKQWEYKYIDYKPHYIKIQNKDSLIYIEKRAILKSPKGSWNEFTDSIYYFNIMTLPDYSTLKNYTLPTDPDGKIFEIGTKHEYRLYYYPSSTLSTEFRESRDVNNIVRLFEKEFDFKRLDRQNR